MMRTPRRENQPTFTMASQFTQGADAIKNAVTKVTTVASCLKSDCSTLTSRKITEILP